MEMNNKAPFSLFDEPIDVHFVISEEKSTETQCSYDMQIAYEKCQKTDILPEWIHYDECWRLNPKENDIFVLERFEGRLFEDLQMTKCSIFGPVYILNYIDMNRLIPRYKRPLLNMSMHNVVAHLPGFTKEDKIHFQEMIEQMDGNICTKSRCPCITHHIVDSLPSPINGKEKEGEIKMCTKDWILSAWYADYDDQLHLLPLPRRLPTPIPSPIPSPDTTPTPSRPPSPTPMDQAPLEKSNIFQGLTFTVRTLNSDFLTKTMEKHGGKKLRKFSIAPPDLAIVPHFGINTKPRGKEIVTPSYIYDCEEKNRRIPIQYYHRPIFVCNNVKPLDGCVLAISEYLGSERIYLSELGKALGARSLSTFDQKSRAGCDDGCYVTHFICKSTDGDSYNAAIESNLPAVTGEWLRACSDEWRRVDEGPFLLGDTIIPPVKESGPCYEQEIDDIYEIDEIEDNCMMMMGSEMMLMNLEDDQPCTSSMEMRDFSSTGNRVGQANGLTVQKINLCQQKPVKKKFMLSRIGNKKSYEEVIRALGGEVSSVYDESVTHIVCSYPSTNIETVTCIAGGKWVLDESYLQDSERFEQFLSEKMYEWGNPLNDLMRGLEDEMEKKIAAAAYKWRMVMGREERSVFYGIVAILITDECIYEDFERFIKAGGGTVVKAEHLGDSNHSNKMITHCFVDDSCRKRVDWAMMASKSIWCFPLNFLYTLITTDGAIDPRDHVVPKFRKYMALLP